MNIIEAIKDDRLFHPFLGDLESWKNWRVLLRSLYGLPIKSKRSREFFYEATGRDARLLPKAGFSQFLALTGRRSGKSRITACIAAYEAALGGKWKRCAAGETPTVGVISPRKFQSNIIKNYLRAIFEAPLLRNEIVNETKDGFSLRNGVVIQILAGDGGVTIRGTTAIAICLDEVCFHGVDVDAKIKNDAELVRACLPSLATVEGKLIAISSPYARKGWAYEEHKRAFGNDAVDDILVVNGRSRLFNPTLPQSVVDRALARDLQGAKSEYLGEFRDAVSAFISRDLVESLVVPGRKELLPRDGMTYSVGVDMSAGRHDASCASFCHKDDGKVIVDAIYHFPSPHAPQDVVGEIAKACRRFGCTQVTGDRFAGEWVTDAFRRVGIRYITSDITASEAYGELLPVLTTPDAIDLLDHDVMVHELCSLERRPRSGGKDLISHPVGLGNHDDCINAVALAVCNVNHRRITVGGWNPR